MPPVVTMARSSLCKMGAALHKMVEPTVILAPLFLGPIHLQQMALTTTDRHILVMGQSHMRMVDLVTIIIVMVISSKVTILTLRTWELTRIQAPFRTQPQTQIQHLIKPQALITMLVSIRTREHTRAQATVVHRIHGVMEAMEAMVATQDIQGIQHKRPVFLKRKHNISRITRRSGINTMRVIRALKLAGPPEQMLQYQMVQ